VQSRLQQVQNLLEEEKKSVAKAAKVNSELEEEKKKVAELKSERDRAAQQIRDLLQRQLEEVAKLKSELNELKSARDKALLQFPTWEESLLSIELEDLVKDAGQRKEIVALVLDMKREAESRCGPTADLVPRNFFADSVPDFAQVLSRNAADSCDGFKDKPAVMSCKSAFLQNPFPYHQVDPSFFSPINTLRHLYCIITQNAGQFYYVEFTEWPRGVELSEQSFHTNDVGRYRKTCKRVATFFVDGGTTTLFLAPNANMWCLVCVTPPGMMKDVFMDRIKERQFKQLQQEGAYTFPPCSAQSGVMTKYLNFREFVAPEGSTIFYADTFEVNAGGNIHEKNQVNCSLLG